MVTLLSFRKKLYELWVKNPYTTPKRACQELKEPWERRRKYAKKLLSEFRSYHKLGSPQEAHLPHRRVFVWEKVEGVRAVALNSGWRVIVNANGMLVFSDDRGSVHWYKGGLVRLYLRGEIQLARAKELFCRAFSWFSSEQLSKYLDVPLREESKHWVFELGAPVPRFDLRKFERSHGIRIFADGSHPESIEVEESTPFWIDRFEQVTEKFGVDIQEHLKLISGAQEFVKEVYDQAKEWRKGLLLKPIKREKRPKAPSQKTILEWMI